MFAVIKTGGKQYRVAVGDSVNVEKLEGEEGQSLTLDQVLMRHDGKKMQVGSPVIEGATVEAKIIDQFRDKKVYSFKKRRRQNSRRLRGHRQHLTRLEVTKI